ncbi:hypothetical protein TanjilG_33071 [Lupinus angustifolius]|uniref:Uncharacterized protein n=1 Tax=Lupinus angustifolius TaxID=3871 RepID=A0A1J7HKS1_LUPAN|nr:PREDICTED: uncharacterized protein LOC109345883 [Lupinus angustifolius]OIW13422.1 hypothetical protein TanjilG_33071 [Lupinus angustifolius]
MELNLHDAIINIPNATTNPPHNQDEPKPILHRKRKHSPMHAIRAALFMMRGHKKSKVLMIDDESKSVWRKLVGSMRPLHLQSNQSPRHPKSNVQLIQTTLSSPTPSNEDEGDQAVTPTSNVSVEEPDSPYSPSPPSSRYASAVGLNELVSGDDDNEKHNRYASAIGLNEFVQNDEDNENQEEIAEEECKENGYGDGDNDGDHMIDAKADEFIAQFYKQIRLQLFDVEDRHYKERSHRSLGF